MGLLRGLFVFCLSEQKDETLEVNKILPDPDSPDLSVILSLLRRVQLSSANRVLPVT